MVHNLGLLQMHLYATEQLLTTCIYAEKSALNLHIQRFIVMSNPKLLPLLKIVHNFTSIYFLKVESINGRFGKKTFLTYK